MGLNETVGKAVQRDAPSVMVNDSVRAAIEKLSAAGASALPVKSPAGLVGIVTEMDLMNSVVKNDDLDATEVGRCMTACDLITARAAKTPCVQLDEAENVGNALAIMHEAGVHHLLVTGAKDTVIGMVSAGDLLKLAVS